MCDLQKSSKQGGGSPTEHLKLVKCWKKGFGETVDKSEVKKMSLKVESEIGGYFF